MRRPPLQLGNQGPDRVGEHLAGLAGESADRLGHTRHPGADRAGRQPGRFGDAQFLDGRDEWAQGPGGHAKPTSKIAAHDQRELGDFGGGRHIELSPHGSCEHRPGHPGRHRASGQQDQCCRHVPHRCRDRQYGPKQLVQHRDQRVQGSGDHRAATNGDGVEGFLELLQVQPEPLHFLPRLIG